jgi:HAD superfamily hydrolase (TIGR01490 family)
MMRRRVAIFDVDGTIFRSSLLIEITEALIREGVFPRRARTFYRAAHGRWLDREGPYEHYIDAVTRSFVRHIRGVSYRDFQRIAKRVVVTERRRVYRYTRDLIARLRARRYYLLAISNSPLGVLKEFCGTLGFSKVYGRLYEIDRTGKFTGTVMYEDLIADKAKILKRAIEKEHLSLAGSVGVGDTESDIPFLKLVERPICFNPNRALYRRARRAGWKVVVERKDVIYEL